MPTTETNIKNAIKAELDTLKTAGTLGEVQMDDFNESPIFDREISAYPVAILTGAAIESEPQTNRDNLRTFIFEIPIIQKAENITTSTDIEELRGKIMDHFDNNPTLGGAANGGVEPSVSPAESILSRGKSYIVFTLTLRAKASVSLTF